jgi:hypothetical protein
VAQPARAGAQRGTRRHAWQASAAVQEGLEAEKRSR